MTMMMMNYEYLGNSPTSKVLWFCPFHQCNSGLLSISMMGSPASMVILLGRR